MSYGIYLRENTESILPESLLNVRTGEVYPVALYLFVEIVVVAVGAVRREDQEVSGGAYDVTNVGFHTQRS